MRGVRRCAQRDRAESSVTALATPGFVEFGLSMSTQPNSQPSGANTSASIEWAQPERQAAFHQWLNAQASAHGVLPATVRAASADASFRRYFRVDTTNGSCIVMDAPPDKENCEPFVRIARLMLDAGLYAPRILAWDESLGFMLLDDIGS